MRADALLTVGLSKSTILCIDAPCLQSRERSILGLRRFGSKRLGLFAEGLNGRMGAQIDERCGSWFRLRFPVGLHTSHDNEQLVLEFARNYVVKPRRAWRY